MGQEVTFQLASLLGNCCPKGTSWQTRVRYCKYGIEVILAFKPRLPCSIAVENQDCTSLGVLTSLRFLTETAGSQAAGLTILI